MNIVGRKVEMTKKNKTRTIDYKRDCLIYLIDHINSISNLEFIRTNDQGGCIFSIKVSSLSIIFMRLPNCFIASNSSDSTNISFSPDSIER